MAGTVSVYDPKDQALRRRRARIPQAEIAKRLKIPIPRISEYETGKDPLPWGITPEEYEVALAAAITARNAA